MSGECNCCTVEEEKVEAEFEVCSQCTTKAKCEKNNACKNSYAEEAEAEEVSSCVCAPDEELIDGECRKIAVTLDLDIEDATTMIEASTGETIIEITGIAFHEGINKNGWAINNDGAKTTASQMIGADLTLNHPDADPNGPGFGRATEGLDKSNVGYIKSAMYLPKTDGGYHVRYVAHVTQTDLFEVLESGLYLKADYGVSIGGSGVPVQADEDGIIFGEDFTFDHLAIVHRPAYSEANIESIKRIETPIEIEATLISHSNADDNQPTGEVEIMAEAETPEIDTDAKIEELTASLVLAESRVAEFEAAEIERVEEARMVLVTRASEIGMSGHEDLKSETLETLIASWEASHPDPEPVVMEPVDAEPETPVIASEEVASTSVVANYLNGNLVESDEGIYARCYNAWAKAWNGTLAGDESNMKALPYDEIKEMI